MGAETEGRAEINEALAETEERVEPQEALAETEERAEPHEALAETATAGRPGPASTVGAGAASPPSPELAIGSVTGGGRFEIVAFLGQGGMGQVYRAFDLHLRRNVALKFLRGDDPALAARLLAEAQAQAGIDDPHICKVYEAGQLDGRPYIAMQLIDGRTLGELRDDLSLVDKVQLLEQVAHGMSVAHRLGRIHRDLKPSNILVERRDDGRYRPYVVDFGIARFPSSSSDGWDRDHSVVGTPGYMAPEQARGDSDRADRRADIYGLGATLYDLLVGRPPFSGLHGEELRRRIVEGAVPPPRTIDPRIPADLEAIVLKCLAREPAARYDSTRALAEDLGRFVDGEPILARAASLRYRVLKRLRKHRALVAVAAIAIVVVLAFVAQTLRERSRGRTMAMAADRFGRLVEESKSLMHLGYLLPAHDVRREREAVRERIRRIDEEARRLGGLGDGPAHHSAGRAHLAIGEAEQARERLQAAWDAGYRPAGIASALEEAWVRIYEEAMDDAARASDKAAREAARQRADETYRAPTLRWRDLAAADPADARERVAALLALAERRYDEAVGRADAVLAQDPAAFEARALKASALVAIGQGHYDEGRFAEAERNYAAAERELREGIAVARSHPDSHVELCDLTAHRVYLGQYADPSQRRPMFDVALAACSTAVSVDPDSERAAAALSLAQTEWAEIAAQMGEDQRPYLDAALAGAERILERARHTEPLYQILASASYVRGRLDAEKGADPRPDLARAVAWARRGLAVHPESGLIQRTLTMSALESASWEEAHGVDPRPSIAIAVASAHRGITVAPRDYDHLNDAAFVAHMRGSYELAHGIDPRPSLDVGIADARRAAAMGPEDINPHVTLSDLFALQAEYEIVAGLDPVASLRQAVEHAEQSIAIQADYYGSQLSLGLAHLLRARHEAARGGDPAPWFGRARERFDRALALNPSPECEGALARGSIEQARSDAARGRSPVAALRDAAAAVERGLGSNPADAVLLRLRATIRLEEARSRGRAIGPPLAAAEADLAASIGIDDAEAEAHLGRAEVALLRLQRRVLSGRTAAAVTDDGIAAAERALSLHPALAAATVVRAELLRLRDRR